MSIYCLCEESNDKPDSQVYGAPNRYCAAQPGDKFPPLALRRPMQCIETRVRQVIIHDSQNKPNDWSGEKRPDHYHQHYPYVDVFECPHCHTRIVREI